MRWPTAVLAMALGACASGGVGPASRAAPVPDVPPRIDPTSSGFRVQVSQIDYTATETFPVAPARLWPVALEAYRKLGLRVDSEGQGTAETRGMTFHRKLGRRNPSAYFDCGSTILGNNADTWQLTLDARLAVSSETADSSSATVGALVSVSGTPDGPNSSGFARCSSTGALEAELIETIRKALLPRK